MDKIKSPSATALLAAAFLAVAGCSEPTHPSAHQQGSENADAHRHTHSPPNGGTPVVLGDESFHLEFVANPEAGRMVAYILDGHMEEYVRLSVDEFTVRASLPDGERILTFFPVANRSTGETVGDTASFQAEADWLRDHPEFDAEIVSLDIRSQRFEAVSFHFPTGNE